MPAIRNIADRDLDVGGRVFAMGETVEVSAADAASLLTNPNFEAVTAPPPDGAKPETAKSGKKD